MNNGGSAAETVKDGVSVLPEEDRRTDSQASHLPGADKAAGSVPVQGKEGKPASPSDKKKLMREVREFIIRVAATVMAVWLTLTFLFGIYMCHSDACYPMVKDGDLCVTWRPDAPSQGDLIVYQQDGNASFGRVAAVSGDKVEIIDGVVWVNGFIAVQDRLYSVPKEADAVRYPLTVPENCVFILNDNPSNTNDSRLYGTIPLDNCCGSVVFMMRRRGF